MTRLVDRLDALALEILATYGPAIRQLNEWTAGHPAAVIGASAPTSNPDPPIPSDDDRPTIDHATAQLARLRTSLARLADDGRNLWAEHDGRSLPEPADTDPARLAVVMWTIRRAQRDPNALDTRKLVTYGRRLQRLADLCRVHQPPARPNGVPNDGCTSHARAAQWAPVDDRYRRYQLCRRCGDFRTAIGKAPPPKLVTWAEKHGWRLALAPSTLTRFNVKRSSKRK